MAFCVVVNCGCECCERKSGNTKYGSYCAAHHLCKLLIFLLSGSFVKRVLIGQVGSRVLLLVDMLHSPSTLPTFFRKVPDRGGRIEGQHGSASPAMPEFRQRSEGSENWATGDPRANRGGRTKYAKGQGRQGRGGGTPANGSPRVQVAPRDATNKPRNKSPFLDCISLFTFLFRTRGRSVEKQIRKEPREGR